MFARLFKLSAVLTTTICWVIACGPGHERPDSRKNLSGVVNPPSQLPNAKATFKEQCPSSFQFTALASEKESTSLNEALKAEEGIWDLSALTFSYRLTPKGQSTLYITGELFSGEKVSSTSEVTCHNSKASADKKASAPGINLELSIPKIMDSKKGQFKMMSNITAKTLNGGASLTTKDQAPQAEQTIANFDSKMRQSDERIERQLLIVTDNDGRIHVRSQQHIKENDETIEFEAIYTRQK